MDAIAEVMDQFASAMGKKDNAIFLDTNTLQYEYAPVVLEDAKIVIINSKVKHSLVDSAYNDRRNECETALKEIAGSGCCADIGRFDRGSISRSIKMQSRAKSDRREQDMLFMKIRERSVRWKL